MAYATQADYTAFLRGRTPTIPLAEFDYWADMGSSAVDAPTFNRLHDAGTLAEHATAVIAATCELAEAYFKAENPNADGQKLKGYSIQGYSESYVTPEPVKIEIRVQDIIRRRLGHTGLLYRGV